MSQSTAYHLQNLVTQLNEATYDVGDAQHQQQQQQPSAKKNKAPPRSMQLSSKARKDEADLQKETHELIQRMREQANVGEIPEYGKRIIDVLLHYQGKLKNLSVWRTKIKNS